ncbi:MAG: sulfurtransferase TusA family protein [Coriobacteriales bacterium]|nr:sulfurtransferase TusA family protein [Coriobacteriales bacterium]
MIEVDTKGLSCPEPVLMVQDALKDHPKDTIRVESDRATPRDNIIKLAERSGRKASYVEQGDIFVITIE